MKAKPIPSVVVPLSLVPRAARTKPVEALAICAETIESLEALLTQAKEGALIGLTYVAMFDRRGFTVNVTGQAERHLTYTRGMLLSLDDTLADKIRSTMNQGMKR